MKSPKNDKQKIFFIKQKMLAICHFYNRFSISDPYDSVEGSPDGLVPQEHKIWPSTDQGEANWIFLSWGQDFEYTHPLKYAGIKKFKKWAKKNHPTRGALGMDMEGFESTLICCD